jgi:tyrosyl-tRNA synthetase
MSKSLGNHIPILAPPEDMYGKVMSIPDSALIPYFELATRYAPPMIAEVKQQLAAGVNPRDVKMALAREIVDIFHGPEAAARAEAHFQAVFQKGDLPDEMPEFAVSEGMNIVEIMVALKFAASKGDARRLIAGGGVYLDGRTVTDAGEVPRPPQVLQVGKRRFARLAKA